MKINDIVEISFLDHSCFNGWRTEREIEGIIQDIGLKCKSIGYYVGENKNVIFISQTTSSTESKAEIIQIIKSTITKKDIIRHENTNK